MGSTEHGYAISCSKLFADPVIREVVGGRDPSPTLLLVSVSPYLYAVEDSMCASHPRQLSFEGVRERICVVGSKVVPDSDRK